MKLHVQNGSFSYGQTTLWSDINFSVKSGEILAIMGPNGVGKTTLLRCIMRLLPWKTGSMFIDNQNAAALNASELSKKVAYVPQAKGGHSLFLVKDFILMGRNAYIGAFGKPGKKDYAIAEAIMEDIGILSLAYKRCDQLSGGQFQLVLIARALCAQPECLILDEPESNLDFRNQLLVLHVMKELAKKKGLSCIFNTHYPEHGLRIAQKTVLVSKHAPVISGNTKDVVTEEHLERLFRVKVKVADHQYNQTAYQTVTALELL